MAGQLQGVPGASQEDFDGLSDQIVPKNVSFTYNSNIASDAKYLVIKRVGNIVVINGYVKFSNTPQSNAANNIANITNSSDRPREPIRLVGGISTNPWDAEDTCYITIDDTSGDINVRPKSGNTYKSIFFSASYVLY